MGNYRYPCGDVDMSGLVYLPGSIYSPWGYLTEGLGAGGEVAEGCGELVVALVN